MFGKIWDFIKAHVVELVAGSIGVIAAAYLIWQGQQSASTGTTAITQPVAGGGGSSGTGTTSSSTTPTLPFNVDWSTLSNISDSQLRALTATVDGLETQINDATAQGNTSLVTILTGQLGAAQAALNSYQATPLSPTANTIDPSAFRNVIHNIGVANPGSFYDFNLFSTTADQLSGVNLGQGFLATVWNTIQGTPSLANNFTDQVAYLNGQISNYLANPSAYPTTGSPVAPVMGLVSTPLTAVSNAVAPITSTVAPSVVSSSTVSATPSIATNFNQSPFPTLDPGSALGLAKGK